MPEPLSRDPSSPPDDILLAELLPVELIPQAAETRPLLQTGDLVAINRPSVNGRAWMSTIAPILVVLKKSAPAEVLCEPMRSEGQHWVKLRPVGETRDCCVNMRYLDLVEQRPVRQPTDTPSNIGWLTVGTPFHPGDRVTAILTLNARSGAGTGHSILRRIPQNTMGMILSKPVTVDSADWVEARFDNERGWVATRFIRPFVRGGKWIEVDIVAQTVIAWQDDIDIWRAPASTGKPGFRTPSGTFTISKKFPTRRTRATVRDEQWDIPGVPWIMVFRSGGYYFHGVYWHDDFGAPVSHGCVTLSVPSAEWIYHWTPPGTPVWIHE